MKNEYTPGIVKLFFIALTTAVFVAAMVVFATCTKQNERQAEITGVWVRTAPAIEYRFFDDSRFQQSDLPGEQWIWEQQAGRVHLFGNPQRDWIVLFLSDTRARVVEADTFEIDRK
jgi:hypothetical protein